MVKSTSFDWHQFHAYRVFDEFLERFILGRKSYVTRHKCLLKLEIAFDEIHSRFSQEFDESKESFEDKIKMQFESVSEESKIVFANVEFLWSMPVKNISPGKKQSYARRWFIKDSEVVDLASAKNRVAEPSYSTIYKGGAKDGRFAVTKIL